MKTKDLYDEYLITSMVAGFDPVEIESASDTHITASDGTEYLDCFSGISVVNAGHGHPQVIQAAKAQMDKYIHCCTYVYYNKRAGELAKVIADITPGDLQKSFFGNSGAEAIEGALRLAKHYTGRNEFIGLTHSFHGRTYATLSLTGNSGRKQDGGPYMPGVAFSPAPYFYRCPFGSQTEEECGEKTAYALADVIKYHTSGNVAAFIAEPIMGEGGIIVPPENYFPIVKDILEKRGILFIADEVQSGYGRTGELFAINHYGVTPDIMTMAKGIADGFPLSAFTAKAEIADAFTPGSHLSTFGGNPVSCAAALANIRVLQEESMVENAKTRGLQLMQGLQALKEQYPLIGDVRGKGLMIGIELVSDESKTPAAKHAQEIKKLCRESGMLIGVGGSYANVLRLQPPLTLSKENAEFILSRFGEIFEKL